MGILDEAIREHLELKRQHGADDSQLRQLEDEAFGPPGRPGDEEGQPDPLAEAATEFMEQPDLGEEQAPEGEASGDDDSQAEPSRREPVAGIVDLQEAPEQVEDEDDDIEDEHDDDEPAEEEQPAAEHEAISSPPVEHSTEERHAIADQPTEMFDVEEEFSASQAREASDEDLVAEEIAEPRLAPVDPIANFEEIEGGAEVKIEETGAAEEEEEDDFFDEQRLSDELDQALEAPVRTEPEEEEEKLEPEDDDGDEPGDDDESDEGEQPVAGRRDEDLLEETPDFLEEAPEDDRLWFEQKPPKDFDFDD